MVEVNLTEKRYNLINTYLNELAKYIESQDYAKCLLISVINYSDEYEEDLFDEDLLRDTSILLTIACDDRENVSYKALEEECNNELAYKINRTFSRRKW